MGVSMWSSEYEQISKVIGEKSEGLAWMHLKSAKLFRFVNVLIMSMSICVTIFICAFSFSELSCRERFFHWFLGSLGAFAAFLSIMHKCMEPSEMFQKHFDAYMRYSALYRKVGSELILTRGSREDVEIFIPKIKELYEQLHINSALIPDCIINRYKKHNSHKSIKPEIANGYMEIVIAE